MLRTSMEKAHIASVAATVLFIEDASTIRHDRSLILDYGMSSIDFVDFAFELKSQSGTEFDPDDLWPVGQLMTDPDCFADGSWTEHGTKQLRQIFGRSDIPADVDMEQLYGLLSVDYVAARLSSLSGIT